MKCCICGAVKNVGQYLDRIFINMEKIGSLFEDYVIILSYGPSSDNTLQIIKDYMVKNPKVELYVKQYEESPFRTQRIAFARNRCLDIIRGKYSNYDFFIMMDCDSVNYMDVKLDVLKKFLERDDWDALSFNKSEYYDIWALSIYPYFFSCRHFNNPVMVGLNMEKYINNLLKNIPENGLLKCASAFGGFAIYRMNMFIDCNYDGKPRLDLIPSNLLKKNMEVNNSPIVFSKFIGTEQTKYEDCEHRAFHMEAIKKHNARIRISPEILF